MVIRGLQHAHAPQAVARVVPSIASKNKMIVVLILLLHVQCTTRYTAIIRVCMQGQSLCRPPAAASGD
jgi:hypothetical protein